MKVSTVGQCDSAVDSPGASPPGTPPEPAEPQKGGLDQPESSDSSTLQEEVNSNIFFF